ELGDVVLIDRNLESARLGEERGHVVEHRQFVASLAVGGDDFTAVGDGDVGQAWFVGVFLGILVAVFEGDTFQGPVFGSGLSRFRGDDFNRPAVGRGIPVGAGFGNGCGGEVGAG